jgi:uncharacterized membrane protein
MGGGEKKKEKKDKKDKDERKPNVVSRVFNWILGSSEAPKEPEGYKKPTAPPPVAPDQDFYHYISDSMTLYSPFTAMKSRFVKLDAAQAKIVLERISSAAEQKEPWLTERLGPMTVVIIMLQQKLAEPPASTSLLAVEYQWQLWAEFILSYDPKSVLTPIIDFTFEWRKEMRAALAEALSLELDSKEYRKERLASLVIISMMLDIQEHTFNDNLTNTMPIASRIRAYATKHGLETLINFAPFLATLRILHTERGRRHVNVQVLDVVLNCLAEIESSESLIMVCNLVKEITSSGVVPSSSLRLLASLSLKMSLKTDVEIARWFMAFQDWSRNLDRQMILDGPFADVSSPLVWLLLEHEDPTLFGSAFSLLVQTSPIPKADWLKLFTVLLHRRQLTEDHLDRLPADLQLACVEKMAPLASSNFQKQHYSKTREGALGQVARAVDRTGGPMKVLQSTFKALVTFRDWFKAEDWSPNLLDAPDDEELILKYFPFLKEVDASITFSSTVNSSITDYGPWSPPEILIASFLARRSVPQWNPDIFPSRFQDFVATLADPHSRKHVPPSLYAVFLCHRLLEALHNYASSDMSLLFDSLKLSKVVPFLQWFIAVKGSMSKRPELARIYEASNARYNSFTEALVGFLNGALNLCVTIPQARLMVACKNFGDFEKILNVAGAIRLTSESIKDAERVANGSLLQMNSFMAWFKHVGVTFNAPVLDAESLHLMTIAAIHETSQRFKGKLTDAGFNDNMINSLKAILLPHRSELFTMIFEEERSEYIAGQKMTPQMLAKVVQKACQRLESMFSQDTTFAKLEKLWHLVDRLGSARLKHELVQLQAIVKNSGAVIAVEELSAYIENGAALREYATGLPKLMQFIAYMPSMIQIVPALGRLDANSNSIINELQLVQSRLRKLDDLQVRNIEMELKTVKASLRGLEPHTLTFFEELPLQHNLLRFCSRSDFHDKVGILTGQLQGMAFANKLISSVVSVHTMLSPILNFAGLLDLFKAVVNSIGRLTPEELQVRLQHFELCRNHLTELEMYFSGSTGDSAAAMLPTAMRSLESGRYLVHSSLHPKGFSLILEQLKKKKEGKKHREVETSLEGQNLHGRLRGMTVFLDRSTLKPEEFQSLMTFDTCYIRAIAIANAFEALVKTGHPAFQEKSFTIGRGRGDMKVELYDETLHMLLEEAESWQTQLDEAAAQCPRLLFLSPKTTAGFLSKVHRLFETQSAAKDTDWIFQRTLPYLLLCVPEIYRCTSQVPFTPAMVAEAFFSGEHELLMAQFQLLYSDPAKWSPTELYSHLLKHTALMLTSLTSRPDIQALIDNSGDDKIGKPRVIKAVDMKPVDLFRVVAQASEGIPHPSQVLYCSRSLSSNDLNRFLDCARIFPTLHYTIYGVNELTHDLRQQLLLWSSDVACQAQSTHAQVILLFTAERSGEDMFGFLPTEPANPTNFEFAEKSADILAARNIGSLHCLFQGQGKSTAARQYLENPKRDISIELSIAEHFRRDKFIHKLSQLIDSNDPLSAKTVALHLDIKPYAQIEAVSRFLNYWLYFGFVFDPSTGQAFFATPAGMKPNQATGLKWHIVVELSSPLAGDPEFSYLVPKANEGTPPILHHLPSVFHLKSGTALPPYQLPINADMRLLAGLLQALPGANFTPHAEMGSQLTDVQVYAVFESRWRHITCLRRRHAIIDLMCASSRDFVNLCVLLSNNFVTNTYNDMLTIDAAQAMALLKKRTGSKALFEMLLAEAEFLSDTSGKALPVPLVIRKKVPAKLPVFQKGAYDVWETEMSEIMPTTDWTVVSFTDPEKSLVDRSPLPVAFFGRPQSAKERADLRGTLRRTLAEALGVKNTGKMWSIIEQKRYVLTPHLAHKMLHLHARKRSGNNVILVGDTGQGKTEMVDFYSLFLNMDSELLPDLLGSLSTLANDFIRSMYRTDLGIKRANSEYVNRMEVLKVFSKIAKTDKPLEAEALPVALPQLLTASSSLLGNSQAVPAPAPAAAPSAPYKPTEPYLTQATNEEDHTCWPDLRETLNTWLATMLHRYPLLLRTPEVQKLSPIKVEEEEESENDETDDEHAKRKKAAAKPLVVPKVDPQIWKKKSLDNILNQILELKTVDLFHKQLMYRGLSIEEFSSVVKRVKESAKAWPEMQVLFFVDESNTTSFMGRLKELMVDHRWENEALPENVFIVAAINPQEIDRAQGQHDVTQSKVDFSRNLNVQTGVRAVSAFDVRPPHPSMEQLYYYFAEMDEAADDDFWEAMIELGANEIGENERRTVIDYVLIGHHQIRKALIGNMHPSIRDLVRALNLFKFFRRSTFGAILLQELTMEDARGMELTLPSDALQREFSPHFWKALFMTLAVGYYFRLLNLPTATPSSRRTLLQAINSKFEQEPIDRRVRGVSFQSTMDAALKFLFHNTQIPSAIAPTFALMENLFCTVVCVDMKMPLTISGPAGCSKTLSFTIAIDNMRGAGSKKSLYKFCQQMHHYRYQCSPMSSDEEISAVYDDATARQAGLSGSQLSGVREMCTVLLDELNLAENGSSQPLKVIHGKLDHPKVMTVILTNKLLDPAKTNRTLQVLQSVPSEDDLLLLAKDCLFESRAGGVYQMTPVESAIIEGSRLAYSILATRTDLSMKYQLRDFVYFLRALRNTCRSNLGDFEMTSQKLMNAILRNFGGLSEPREQWEIVRLFFTEINQKIDIGTPFTLPSFNISPTQILRESVKDTIPLDELNPNINSSRYLCLLDPSDSCTSVNLLFEMGIVNRSNATIIACSDFEQDSTEEGVNERVMKVKDAMANGDTVILVAADGIYGNFYDLFNKHFTIVPAENVKLGDPMVTFFSSVAVGSMSRPCKVHPSFKVIVHLPISQLPNTPLPFLSRFEKYVLSIDHCLMEKAAASGLVKAQQPFFNGIPAQGSQLDALVEGVTHFYDTVRTRMKGQYPFHGFVPQQTIKSLAMATLGRCHDSILDPVPLPRFLVDDVNDVDPSSIPVRSDNAANWMAHLIRMTNFRLLQIVRPDAAAQFRFLPEEYLREYFLRQEHLSAAHLLRSVLMTATPKGEEEAEVSASPNFSRKWVISARSSDEVARLHNDKPIQELITSNLKAEIQFLSLANFSSLAALNAELAEFAASNRECIVITADMRTCSTSQINDLRREVDNHLRGHSDRFVFVLLHHPPEHAQSPQDAYPAIFWDDWDFYYTDSLGLTSIEPNLALPGFDEEDLDDVDSDASSTDSEDDILDEKHYGKNSADARAWIAKAVGLDVDISPESVVRHFKEQFKVEFATSLRLLSNANSASAKRLKHASKIYLDRTTRQKELLKLIDDHPLLVDIILEQFAHYWTDSLLHKIVEGTGDAIRDGKATGAYVPLIQNSLRFMLISVCKQLLDALLGNFNMEGILQVLQELKNPETKLTSQLKLGFVAASLQLVPPPSIETILEASQVDQNFYSTPQVPRGFKLGKGLVTALPLFDVVCNAISQSVASAMRRAGISSTHENMDIFIHHFMQVLEEQKELKEVLQFIDTHPVLQDIFFEDFIRYQLGIPQLTASLNGVVKGLLRAHLEEIKSRVAIPAVAVFLLGPEVRNAISHVGLCLVPLNSMHPSEEAVQSLIDTNAFLHVQPAQMEGNVHKFSVQLLSMGLMPNMDDDDEEEDQKIQKLWQWFISIRDIHVRITSARLQRACVDGVLTWYHRMLLLFQTVTSFRLNANELYQLVLADRAAGMDGILKSNIEDLRSTLLQVEALSKRVAVIRNWDLSNEAFRAGLAQLVQSIVSQAISFDPYTHIKVINAPKLVTSIRLFLKLAAQSDLDIPPAVKVYLTPQWCLGQLSGLVSKVTSSSDERNEWFEQLKQLSVDALSCVVPGTYAPFVPFLTSESDLIREGLFFDEDTGDSLTPVRTFVKPHQMPYNPLEVIWFQIFQHLFEYQQVSDDFSKLYEMYEALNVADAIGNVQRVAIVSWLVKLVAEGFSSLKGIQEMRRWGDKLTPFLKEVIMTPHTIEECMTRGWPADIMPYFFACMKTTESVQQLLGDENGEKIGLEAGWHVDDLESMNSRCFRWMNINSPVDHRHNMYDVLTQQLEEDPSPQGLAALLQTIDDLLVSDAFANAEQRVYDLRMVLMMSLYTNYMSQGERCEVVAQNLAAGSPLAQKLLLASPLELKAMAFVSCGPLVQVHPNNDVARNFSAELQSANGEFNDEALLLIMTLAAAMGMPPETNHMWTLIFNTTSLNRYTQMVGSTFKFHADCGFKADFVQGGRASLDADPSILGNLPRHRLALNASYWAAFTWAFLLDPVVTTAHAINRHNHILNDLPNETTETCLKYTYTRANGFAWALQHVGVDEQKSMDPIFYMSEYLLRLQSIVNCPSADRDPAWKAKYSAVNYEDLHAYHRVLQAQVFVPVDAGLASRANTYLDLAAKRGDVMAYMMELRKRPLTHFDIVLPSSSMVTTWISQKRIDLMREIREARQVDPNADLPVQSGEESLLSYIERFLGMQVPLIANRLIPSMVQYFDALSSVVDGRFTNEELLTFTMRQLFERLRESKKETDASVEKLYRLTHTFCQNIDLFKALIPILDGCGIVDREFEYRVDQIDIDKTSPGLLLGIKQEGLGAGNFDRIRTMVKNLVDRHNVCITDRGTVRALGWNENEFLFAENTSSSPVIPLHALHQTSQSQSEQNFALITGDVPLLFRFAPSPDRAHAGGYNPYNGALDFKQPEIGDQSYTTPFCSPIFSFIASTFDPATRSCNWMSIGEYIASVYTGGRHELSQLPDWPISERRTNFDENGFAAGHQDPSRLLSLDYVDQLKQVTNEFESILPARFKHAENRALWKTHLVLDTPTLTGACKHFYQILSHFVSRHLKDPFLAEDALGKSLTVLEREANLPPFIAIPHRDVIFKLNGSYLRSIALFLIESFEEYRHFYTEQSRIKFAEDFSVAQLHHFEGLIRSLDDNQDLEAFNAQLLLLKRTLSEEKILKLADQKTIGSPLINLIADRAGLIDGEFLRVMLPDDIKISHFTTMLRKLEVLIRETRIKLRARMPSASAKDLYRERVPEHFLQANAQQNGVFVPEPEQFVPALENAPNMLDQILEQDIPEPVAVMSEFDILFGIQPQSGEHHPTRHPFFSSSDEIPRPAKSQEKRTYTGFGPTGALDGYSSCQNYISGASSSNPMAASSSAAGHSISQAPSVVQYQNPATQAVPISERNILPFAYHPSPIASPPQIQLSDSYAMPFPTREQYQMQQNKPAPSQPEKTLSSPPSVALPPIQPTSSVTAAPSSASTFVPKDSTSNSSSLASSSASQSSPALSRSTVSLSESKLLSSHADRLRPLSAGLKTFAEGWRTKTNSTALTGLAKSMDLSSQRKELVSKASQLTSNTLVMWAEKEPSGFDAKIGSNGSTFLHVALRVANWNAITVLVSELESSDQLLAHVVMQVTEGGTKKSVADLALEMLSHALTLSLNDEQLWEIIEAASLLDILVVACTADAEIKAKAIALLVRMESQHPDLRERFEIWHEGTFGAKYDEEFDFVFP